VESHPTAGTTIATWFLIIKIAASHGIHDDLCINKRKHPPPWSYYLMFLTSVSGRCNIFSSKTAGAGLHSLGMAHQLHTLHPSGRRVDRILDRGSRRHSSMRAAPPRAAAATSVAVGVIGRWSRCRTDPWGAQPKHRSSSRRPTVKMSAHQANLHSKVVCIGESLFGEDWVLTEVYA
jgi:hypothetical protein